MPTIKDTQAAGAATLTDDVRIFWIEKTDQFCIHPAGEVPIARAWKRLYTYEQALALASTATAPSTPTDAKSAEPAAVELTAEDAALIVSALENSTPKAAHYPEPVERHAAALKAARALSAGNEAQIIERLRERIKFWKSESVRQYSVGFNEAHADALAATSAPDSAAPSSLGVDREELEAVIACLGDDAASLRADNSEDERADNMERAAELLEALTTPAQAPAIQAPEAVVTETSAVWSAIADYMMANEALQRRRAEGHLMNAEWIDAVQNAATVVDAAIFALATPSAAVSAEPEKEARERGFTEGTIAALACVRAQDQEVLWNEIVNAAGRDRILQHAAHVEPEDWKWAGFSHYVKRKPARATPAPAPTQPQQGTAQGEE